MSNKGTYKRKYYLHRRIKAAGFNLHLEHKHKTINVQNNQVHDAQENKYVAELQSAYSYGVQILNPMTGSNTTLKISSMEIPVKISQNWKTKNWNAETRKWEIYPVVSAKQTQFDRMKPISRKVWFDYIRKGWMTVTVDLRKWLDENGFSDIKAKQLR